MIRISLKMSAKMSALVREVAVKEKRLTVRDVQNLQRVANHIDRQFEALERAMAAYREEFRLMADYKARYLALLADQETAKAKKVRP